MTCSTFFLFQHHLIRVVDLIPKKKKEYFEKTWERPVTWSPLLKIRVVRLCYWCVCVSSPTHRSFSYFLDCNHFRLMYNFFSNTKLITKTRQEKGKQWNKQDKATRLKNKKKLKQNIQLKINFIELWVICCTLNYII